MPPDRPPKVFISYCQDSASNTILVELLANRLKSEGIDVTFDLFQVAPHKGWLNWMASQIKKADYVIMVCTAAYYRAVMRDTASKSHLGARWEGELIINRLYYEDNLSRFAIALPNSASLDDIPDPFRASSRYPFEEERGYALLLAHLRGDPPTVPTLLGPRVPAVRHAALLNDESFPGFNPFFTGRRKIIGFLTEQFNRPDKVGIVEPQALSGLGGTGKTQIALRYAYENSDRYDNIFWILARSMASIRSGYSKIAQRVKLREATNTNHDEIIEATKKWLGSHSDWLMIIDSADEPELIRPFLIRTPGGHFIITTRSRKLHDIAKRNHISEFSIDEAVSFIKTRLGIKRLDKVRRTEAQNLATRLGSLPLALEQAMTYIDNVGCSLQEYLEHYNQRGLELLEEHGPVTGAYPNSVKTTWRINFDMISERNKESAQLFRVCAFLAPDRIPLELFSLGSAGFDDPLSRVLEGEGAIDKVIEPLLNYWLVERNGDRSFSIHELLQVVQRDAISEIEWEPEITQAAKALADAFVDPLIENWSSCDRLVTHVLTLLPFLQGTQQISTIVVQLYQKLGFYLTQRARFDEAEMAIKGALQLSDKLHEFPERIQGQSLNQLAELYGYRGLFQEAERLYKEAMDQLISTVGRLDSDVGASLTGLGWATENLGRYSEAEAYLREALDICGRTDGPNHPNYHQVLNNLACNLYFRGCYKEAIDLHQKVLQFRRLTLGNSDPKTAETISNLASAWDELGDYPRTISLYKECLFIRQKIYGDAHPLLALDLNNLGVAYYRLDEFKDAEDCYHRSLQIRIANFGENHPDVAETLGNLGMLYLKIEQYTKAEDCLDRALRIQTNSFGERHPYVGMMINNLARIYCAMGFYENSDLSFISAISILEDTLGKDHLYVSNALYNFAVSYVDRGLIKDARRLFERSLDIRVKATGVDSKSSREAQDWIDKISV